VKEHFVTLFWAWFFHCFLILQPKLLLHCYEFTIALLIVWICCYMRLSWRKWFLNSIGSFDSDVIVAFWMLSFLILLLICEGTLSSVVLSMIFWSYSQNYFRVVYELTSASPILWIYADSWRSTLFRFFEHDISLFLDFTAKITSASFMSLPWLHWFCEYMLIREGTLPSIVLSMVFRRILILPPKLLPRRLWVYYCFTNSLNICYYICISWRMWFLNSIVNWEFYTYIPLLCSRKLLLWSCLWKFFCLLL
jgi:hypothetical protein